MCGSKKYEVDKIKVGSSNIIFIGNRYMVVKNNLIDTVSKTITPFEPDDEEFKEFLKKLEETLEK